MNKFLRRGLKVKSGPSRRGTTPQEMGMIGPCAQTFKLLPPAHCRGPRSVSVCQARCWISIRVPSPAGVIFRDCEKEGLPASWSRRVTLLTSQVNFTYKGVRSTPHSCFPGFPHPLQHVTKLRAHKHRQVPRSHSPQASRRRTRRGDWCHMWHKPSLLHTHCSRSPGCLHGSLSLFGCPRLLLSRTSILEIRKGPILRTKSYILS